MARLYTCGWETNNVDEAGVFVNSFGSRTVVSSSPTPQAPGVYCLKLSVDMGGGHALQRFATSALTDFWIRYYIYPSSTITSEPKLIMFWGPGTFGYGSGHISWSGSDNKIRAYGPEPSNSLLGASTLTMSEDAWHLLEVRFQIISGTDGVIQVYVDGTEFLNLTGIDNTAPGTTGITQIDIGSIGANSGSWLAIDDLAINSTSGTLNNGRIGDGRVVLLKPNGAGSSTQLARGGTDTGANWSQVSETPFAMTQYVQSTTVGQRDLYTLGDVPGGYAGVNIVEGVAYGLKSESDAASIGVTIKSGSTIDEASAAALGTTAGTVTARWEADPATSAAWTTAAVNALEAGVTIR